MSKSRKNNTLNSSETRPSRVAVALQYVESEMSAPQVSFLGRDSIAEEILKVSRRYGVPVKKSRVLAEKLSKIPAEEPIPEELYDEVAEVFLSLNKVDR